jgi:HK97 gp10 family phage protein
MSDFNNQLNDALKKVDLWGGRVHNALGQALINGAFIIEGAAKQNIHSRGTGNLARSITESELAKKDNELSIQVGPTVVYGPMYEWGTSPHTNSSGADESLEFEASVTRWGELNGMSKEEIDGLIYHIRKYGTKPHPFLGPAYYSNIEKIKQEIAQALGKA